MMIPTCPGTNFIIRKPSFAFGPLETIFYTMFSLYNTCQLILEGEQSLVASYRSALLKEVLRLKDIASTAKLQFQNDYPLRMDFSNGTAKGMIVLAPRVTDN